MNNLCTLYSSERIENPLLALINEKFKQPKIKSTQTAGNEIFTFSKSKGFLKGKLKVQLSTRYRENIDLDQDTSALAANLQGIKGFISNISAASSIGIETLDKKIDTCISEISILCSEDTSPELYDVIASIAKSHSCVLFAQTDSFVGKGNYPHFLNEDLKLLLDVNGHSEVYPPTGPSVEIEPQDDTQLFPDQIERKERNIAFVKSLGVPTIDHLPCVESENEVVIRNSEEIAARAVALSITNFVAFNNITGEEAKKVIEKYSLTQYVTPDELNFLNNPTDELKNQLSWRCESIWTLCWALGIIDDLGDANALADLNNIQTKDYPLQQGVNPIDFITKKYNIRSKKEILDQTDLYYRLNWACVNERLKGGNISAVHPGVVYERQYALNWLTNYMNQNWDDVTCDT